MRPTITMTFTTSREERTTPSRPSPQGIQLSHLFSTYPCMRNKQRPIKFLCLHKASSCQWYEPGTVHLQRVLKCSYPSVKWPIWVKFHGWKYKSSRGKQGVCGTVNLVNTDFSWGLNLNINSSRMSSLNSPGSQFYQPTHISILFSPMMKELVCAISHTTG